MCSINISGFTTNRINCKVSGNKITIVQGFTFLATTAMTDADTMVPPIIQFTIPALVNPRTSGITAAFGLQIFSELNKEIYTWDPKKAVTVNAGSAEGALVGPAVRMKTAATPQKVVIERGSQRNGVVTDFNFTVVTTNFLIEGD